MAQGRNLEWSMVGLDEVTTVDQYRKRISLGIQLKVQSLDVLTSSLSRTVVNGAPNQIPDAR
jgi:hypothetical protein